MNSFFGWMWTAVFWLRGWFRPTELGRELEANQRRIDEQEKTR